MIDMELSSMSDCAFNQQRIQADPNDPSFLRIYLFSQIVSEDLKKSRDLQVLSKLRPPSGEK